MTIHQPVDAVASFDELVMLRFLEAADTMRRLPSDRGPRGGGGGWPFPIIAEVDEERDPSRWSVSFTRRQSASAAAISRMEEVFDWHLKILGATPNLSRAIWCFAHGRIVGRSATENFRRYGMSRQSGFRWMEQGIRAVATALQAQHAPLVSPDLEHLGRIGLIRPSQASSSRITPSPRNWRAEDARPTAEASVGFIIVPRPRRRRRPKPKG